MAAEASGDVDLSHDVLDLNRLNGYAIGQPVVQTAAGRGGEGVLCCGNSGGIIRDVRATEKELCIGIQTRMPPVKPRPEHVGQQLVVDSGPCIGVTTDIRNQSQSIVQVVFEISRATVASPLSIVIRGVPSKTSIFTVRVCKRLCFRSFSEFGFQPGHAASTRPTQLEMRSTVCPAHASFHTSLWPKRSAASG